MMQRRRGDLRGRDPDDDALCAGEVARTAKRDDAALDPLDAESPAHSDIERAAVPPIRVRSRGTDRARRH